MVYVNQYGSPFELEGSPCSTDRSARQPLPYSFLGSSCFWDLYICQVECSVRALGREATFGVQASIKRISAGRNRLRNRGGLHRRHPNMAPSYRDHPQQTPVGTKIHGELVGAIGTEPIGLKTRRLEYAVSNQGLAKGSEACNVPITCSDAEGN